MLSVAATELWCLYTKTLVPTYVVGGSIVWMLAWGLEIALWTTCGTTTGTHVPGFCPVEFHDGKGIMFDLTGLDGAKGAIAGAAVLILLYAFFISPHDYPC